MERALRESDEKYRLLVENCSEAIFIAQDGMLKFVNQATSDLAGFSEDELLSIPFPEFIDPRDREQVVTSHLLRLKGQAPPGAYSFRIVAKNGDIKWVELHAVLVSWEDRPATLNFVSDITERRKVENALAESEARYRSIFENLQDVYYEAAMDGTILELSPSVSKHTSYQREDLIGSSVYDIYDVKEQREKVLELLRTNQKITDYELILKNKNGPAAAYAISSQLLYDAQGKPLKIVGMIRDIAERKIMEETLRASENRFKTAFYTSPDAISINHLKSGRYVDINEGFTRSTGYTREDVIGKTPEELGIWHRPEDRMKLVRALKKKRFYENYEAQFRHKDNSIHTSLLSARVIELQNEPHVLCITRDISDRKKAESRQIFVNQLLELINSGYEPDDSIGRIALLIKEFTDIEAIGLRIQSGSDYPYYETRGFPASFVEAENSLCSYDENNEIILDTEGNPYLECMCGNILRGRTDPSLPFFTAGGSFWSNNTTKLLASTTDEERQTRTRNRCNGEGYESVALIPLKSNDHIIGLLQFNDRRANRFTLDMIEFFEKIGAAIGIALQRKQTEEKLKKEEERYRTVADFTYDWEYWLGEDGHYQYLSPSFERITGYEAARLIDDPALIVSIIHPADRPAVLNHLRDSQNPTCPLEFRIIRKDGGQRWISHRCQHVRDKAGKALGWRGSNRDVTDRKVMESQLIQSQKMEAIGTLAGGIAHDFNNILGAIIGYAEMAHEEVPAESITQECIDQILKAGERAKFLVDQILAFSRHADVNKKMLMIFPLVKEVVKLLRHALPATIRIKEDLRAKDAFIIADATQIHQVLMNLCTNAGHAMRERGGVLTIGLSEAVFDASQIFGHDRLEAGSYVELSVSDTGSGIDSSIMDRIFEPFFTTKKKGEGTGMGLSIVYGIVKGCGGGIRVTSSPGAGTTFSLYLPAQKQISLPEDDGRPKAKAGGEEKILLVEDQDYMLKMMNSMLSRLGYVVTAKADPREALTLFAKNPDGFDLIITDQTMPHLTGADMALKILRIRPDIPIILCTGFSDLVSAEDARDLGIRAYMQKPIAGRELAKIIRDILDRERMTPDEDLKTNGECINP